MGDRDDSVLPCLQQVPAEVLGSNRSPKGPSRNEVIFDLIFREIKCPETERYPRDLMELIESCLEFDPEARLKSDKLLENIRKIRTREVGGEEPLVNLNNTLLLPGVMY